MIYWRLFLNFFYIGMLSFGGGMSAIPLVESQIVQANGWLTYEEFTSLITIAEMTPGPIAVNSASFVGVRLAGPLGALIATSGVIAPSVFIIGALAYFLRKHQDIAVIKNALFMLRPFIVCLILKAGLKILDLAIFKASFDYYNLLVFIGAFVLLHHFKINPIKVMLLVGVIGGVIATLL